MEWLFGRAAAIALGGALLLASPAQADTTQATSTQVVNFAVASSSCPQHGLYGIAHVTVNGTAGMTADQNFIWTTQTAATSIHSVPPEGAVANVTVVYHCNVQVLWWLEPGPARKVSASLWVNGSGEQPSYTIGQNQVPAAPTQSAPAPTQPAPAPTQPAPAPTQPAPAPAPTQPAPAPAPTQPAPAPAPAPTQPAPTQPTP